MALYCGIDLHSTNCWVSVLLAGEQVIRERRIGNNLQQILEFLEPFREELEGIAVESTYNWYWLVDGLVDAGYRVHLTNTWAIKQYERLKHSDQPKPSNDKLFGLFRPPADSAVTPLKLTDLQRRVNQLRCLISAENRPAERDSEKHLATFVLLNPHARDYAQHLGELMDKMSDDDPLRDNVLLAQTKLIADEQLRAEKLTQLHGQFQNTDGGVQALYALGLLKIKLYQNEPNPEKKKDLLADARATLTSLISLYPDSFCAEQVQKNLDDLPAVD